MRKAIWIASLIGILLVASIVALRWQERAPDDEEMLAGAVRFLQTSAVRRIVGAISVDAAPDSALEPAPGLSANAWTLSGDVTIEDIWGRSERYSYRAELESLCKMYRRAACWSLEALSIGDWSLTSSTPTALGLDGLGMMTVSQDRSPPEPQFEPEVQSETMAEAAVEATEPAEPDAMAADPIPEESAPEPVETAAMEMPEPVRFADPRTEAGPPPAEPQATEPGFERRPPAGAPGALNPESETAEATVPEPPATEPSASKPSGSDSATLVLAPARPASDEKTLPGDRESGRAETMEATVPEPAPPVDAQSETVAEAAPGLVPPAEPVEVSKLEPRVEAVPESVTEPVAEPLAEPMARTPALPPAAEQGDFIAGIERRVVRLLDGLAWDRSGPPARTSGASVTIALPPIGGEDLTGVRDGDDGPDGGAVEVALRPNPAAEDERPGLLDRMLGVFGWERNGQATHQSPLPEPDRSGAAGNRDQLEAKKQALAALEAMQDSLDAGSAGASGQGGGKAASGSRVAIPVPKDGGQADLLAGQDLGDKLGGTERWDGEGGMAARAHSYYAKALELSHSRPEVFSMQTAESPEGGTERPMVAEGGAVQSPRPADGGEQPAKDDQAGLSADLASAAPQSAEITVTASLTEHNALLASEPLLSASIADRDSAPAGSESAKTGGSGEAEAPAAASRTQSAALVVPKSVESGIDWVQLGMFRVPGNAPTLWKTLQRSQPDLVGGLGHEILLREREGRDTLHVLQIGPLGSRAEAQALCDALSARRIDCVAVRRRAALPGVQAAAPAPAAPQSALSEPAPQQAAPETATGEALAGEPVAIELVRLIPQPPEPNLAAQDGLDPAPRQAAADPGRADLYGQALELNRRGQGFYRDGRYDKAIEAYDEAIRLDPGFASAYNNRGEVYYRKGDYEQAILDFSSAIHLAPHYSFAFYNRASANRLLGNGERALADLGDVIRLNPQNDLAYHERAQALYQLGRHQQALDDADRAVQLSPGQADYLLTHAKILAALGYRSDALVTFEEGLSASSSDGVRRYQEALMRQGFYEGPLDGLYSQATRSALMSCIDVGCEVPDQAR